MIQPALTVIELIEALERIVKAHPNAGRFPVHLLDMDSCVSHVNPWDSLVTHAELDCFDSNQGQVVSLLAWPESDTPNGLYG